MLTRTRTFWQSGLRGRSVARLRSTNGGKILAKRLDRPSTGAWMPAQVEIEKFAELLCLSRRERLASGGRSWVGTGCCCALLIILRDRLLPARFLGFLGFRSDLLLKILFPFLFTSSRFAFTRATAGRPLSAEASASRVAVAPAAVSLLVRGGRRPRQNCRKNGSDGERSHGGMAADLERQEAFD